MILGRSRLPCPAIHTLWIEEVALVGVGVITDLTTTVARLPASVASDRVPATLVVAIALSDLVMLVHERVVKESEIECHELFVIDDRSVHFIRRINRDTPWDIQHLIHVSEELLLVFLGREIGT